MQAKESTQIPDEVMDVVHAELDKRGEDRSRITVQDVRVILKNAGCSNYYNHCSLVWTKATGLAAPVITAEQEAELLEIFSRLQEPWERVRPKGRKNMLSYEYILSKVCYLLGYDQLASKFKLLKSRDKLASQNAMWKRLCEELDFEFVRSGF